MKTLIVTSQDHETDTVTQQLSAQGYAIKTIEGLEAAIDTIQKDHYELVFLPLDGAPDTMRETVNKIRRSAVNYIYIAAIFHDEHAKQSGQTQANCGLVNNATLPQALETTMQNAQRLKTLIDVIGNNNIDFPSAGGIIARSAFNQLFLSALDRGNRYAELSSILTISLENYQELFNIGGNYIVDYTTALFSKTLVDIRRQSDIIGQIKNHAFSLLLQMPKTETEPVDAARRFAETLSQNSALKEAAPIPVRLKVSLVTLPTGELRFEEFVHPQ